MEVPFENTVEATKRVLAYPLSDGDINKILNPDTKIFTYPDLEMMNSIDDAFDSEGRCMMLYPTTSEYNGHWVCMIKKPNEIEFFDPYGKAPDTQLAWVSAEKRREFNIEKPTLTRLFKESGYRITYNAHDFQRENNDINTCGRHCIVRLLYKKLSLSAYMKMIKGSGLTADEFVAGLTYLKLHK